MTRTYFAPLVTLPTIISSEGRYLTRRGEVVEIKVVSCRHDFGCTGRYADGTPELWHKSGRILATSETANDIIKAMRVIASGVTPPA